MERLPKDQLPIFGKYHLLIEAIETASHTIGHGFEMGYLTLEALNEHTGYWGRSCHVLGHTMEGIVGVARILDGCIHAEKIGSAWTKLQSKPKKVKNWVRMALHSTGIAYASCLVLGCGFDIAAWSYSWLPLPTFFDRYTTFLRSSLTLGRQGFYTAHLASVATKAGLALEEGPLKYHGDDPHQFQMLGFGLDFFSHCIEFGWLKLPFGGEQWTGHCIGLAAHTLMLRGLWIEGHKEDQGAPKRN